MPESDPPPKEEWGMFTCLAPIACLVSCGAGGLIGASHGRLWFVVGAVVGFIAGIPLLVLLIVVAVGMAWLVDRFRRRGT